MAFNLLITSSGGTWYSDLIYQIKKRSIYHPIKIHTTDIKKNVKSKYLADSFNQVPRPKNINYTKKIINVIKKNSIELIIPRSDEEAVRLSKVKKKIKQIWSRFSMRRL